VALPGFQEEKENLKDALAAVEEFAITGDEGELLRWAQLALAVGLAVGLSVGLEVGLAVGFAGGVGGGVGGHMVVIWWSW